MKQITEDNFKTEVLENQSPCLVDFYSTTCGPCRAMEPTLKAAEGKHENVKFFKIEASDGMKTFTEYKVSRVPTFILFKDGQVVDQKLGMIRAEDLDTWIKEKL